MSLQTISSYYLGAKEAMRGHLSYPFIWWRRRKRLREERGHAEGDCGESRDGTRTRCRYRSKLQVLPFTKTGPIHENWPKEEAIKGAVYICTNCQWGWGNIETILTFSGPNWTVPTTPTCPKEKARKGQGQTVLEWMYVYWVEGMWPTLSTSRSLHLWMPAKQRAAVWEMVTYSQPGVRGTGQPCQDLGPEIFHT